MSREAKASKIWKLIIDDREHNIIPTIEAIKKKNDRYASIIIETRRIAIGDYAITCNGVIICIIERKTWKDLAGSIKDGRIFNINDLVKHRQMYGSRVICLIEGKSYKYDSNPDIGHIALKSLRAKIDHMVLRDNISMNQTKDMEDTAYYLFELILNASTIKEDLVEIIKNDVKKITIDAKDSATEIMDELLDDVKKTDKVLNKLLNEDKKEGSNESSLNSKFPLTYGETRLKMLMGVNGITVKIAESILAKYTIKDLFNKHDIIDTIAYESGKSIPKAKRDEIKKQIINISIDTATDMLSCIKSIKKPNIKYLFESMKPIDLFCGKISSETIALTKRSKKDRFGSETANFLIKVINTNT